MQRALFLLTAITALAGAAAIADAQEQADPRTLIPSATLNAIAQHVSGAQAHNHVLETTASARCSTSATRSPPSSDRCRSTM